MRSHDQLRRCFLRALRRYERRNRAYEGLDARTPSAQQLRLVLQAMRLVARLGELHPRGWGPAPIGGPLHRRDD